MSDVHSKTVHPSKSSIEGQTIIINDANSFKTCSRYKVINGSDVVSCLIISDLNLISSHLISIHLISIHLISIHLISSHLIICDRRGALVNSNLFTTQKLYYRSYILK